MKSDFLKNLVSDMNEEIFKSYGEPQTLSRPLNVEKRGVKMPFTWEALVSNPARKGKYVPDGVKWVQYLGYLLAKVKFSIYKKLEKSLDKSRHFEGTWGYDYEEAYMRDFQQRTKWVDDE